MRNLDFSSWQAVFSTVLGLGLITLIGVGIRLAIMQVVQQRRERENRQINERLRTLIAAYKTLGGSFTGNLAVDPVHLRDLRRNTADTVSCAQPTAPIDAPAATERVTGTSNEWLSSDRSRRIRDAVEAALSDIILLGTDEQVRLAAHAANELAAGRPAQTAELVVSLRNFIREVLDLGPVPTHLSIPQQGPARPLGKSGSGALESPDKEAAKQRGKAGTEGSAGGGAVAGLGIGLGSAGSPSSDEDSDLHR
jgi:heme exporter protein D